MRACGLALPTFAAALFLAACGGDGERLTKSEFIAAADAICSEANQALDELGEPSSLAELADYAPRATEIVGGELERLRELRPPETDKALIDRALDLSEQQNDLAAEIGEAAADGDAERSGELLGEIRPLDEEANQIAREYGLEVCGADR